MPRYEIGVVVRAWINTEVVAKTEEEAKEKAQRKADELFNSNGFGWMGGENEIAQVLNLSLLNKLPTM